MATGPAPSEADRARMRWALAGLSPRPGPLDALVRAVVRLGFALVGWRVRTAGLALLPRDDDGRVVPCVLAVAPHRGWIDPFVLLLAWRPRMLRRLAWFGDERTMVAARGGGAAPSPSRDDPDDLPPRHRRARSATTSPTRGAGHWRRGGCLVDLPARRGRRAHAGEHGRSLPGPPGGPSAGGVPLVPVAIGGYLDSRHRDGASGCGPWCRWRLRPCRRTRQPGMRAAHAATDDAGRAALAPAVADLERWSARTNGARPLPGLRRLFR